jgi:ribosomal protein S18 acetylase RimI-like enzyme
VIICAPSSLVLPVDCSRKFIVRVRNATNTDFEAIERLFQLENRTSHSIEPERVARTAEVLTESELDEMIGSDDMLVGVTEEGFVVTGLIFARHQRSEGHRWEPSINRVCVEVLFVDEDYRGHGHASALMEHVIRWAESMQASEVDVEAWTSNDAALALYKELGFREKQLLMTLRLGSQ